MKSEDLEGFVGKNVKILLNNNYQYNGFIIKLSGDCLHFKDKFDDLILIRYEDIKLLKENFDEVKEDE